MKSNKTMTAISVATLLLAMQPAWAAVDIDKGKRLHDKQCTSCHIKRFGGDGSQIYLRADRLIHDKTALGQRVAACSAQTNAGWLPDEEQDVAAYLAKKYYKFK